MHTTCRSCGRMYYYIQTMSQVGKANKYTAIATKATFNTANIEMLQSQVSTIAVPIDYFSMRKLNSS